MIGYAYYLFHTSAIAIASIGLATALIQALTLWDNPLTTS